MMRKEYKLSHFFLLYGLLVLGLVAFIAYGRRTNASANVSQDGLDVYAPFYEKPVNGHAEEGEGHGHEEEHGSDEGHH